MPAELGARNHYNDESGGGEAEVPDPPALCPRFERPQRQEDDGDPLDEDRARPRRSRPVAATGCCERQSRHHEHGHPGIVVAAAREVEREQRVPADQSDRERPVLGKDSRERDDAEHRDRCQRFVEPRRGVGRRARG